MLEPADTHIEPFHAIPLLFTENTLYPNPVHVIPSSEKADILEPVPDDIHNEPFHATAFPDVVNNLVLFVTPVHVIPFIEYAIVFVPAPTATHIEPDHAIAFPLVLNIEMPNPVQVYKLVE
jgi:hypothetical protein